MKILIKEFKEFISRGSVVDLAVAVVVGGAFAKITNSLVNDIIMPFVGIIIGGIDFSSLSVGVGGAMIKYGMFVQAIIEFLLIAFVIFIVIKAINRFEKKEESTPVEDSQDVKLLTEIRDLLKDKQL